MIIHCVDRIFDERPIISVLGFGLPSMSLYQTVVMEPVARFTEVLTNLGWSVLWQQITVEVILV